MKQVTIKNAKGTGILTRDDNGKWSIEVNGKHGSSLYHTDDQVKAIIAKSQANGDSVEVI